MVGRGDAPAAGAEQRLQDLGITLPPPPKPLGSYVEAVKSSKLLFLSGMKGVAFQLAIDRRSMAAEQTGDLTDRNFTLHKLMKLSAIGKGELRIAKRHSKFSIAKSLVSLACRT